MTRITSFGLRLSAIVFVVLHFDVGECGHMKLNT